MYTATVVANKFQQAFKLFNLCHLTYDSKDFLDDETIQEIGNVLLNYMYIHVQ